MCYLEPKLHVRTGNMSLFVGQLVEKVKYPLVTGFADTKCIILKTCQRVNCAQSSPSNGNNYVCNCIEMDVASEFLESFHFALGFENNQSDVWRSTNREGFTVFAIFIKHNLVAFIREPRRRLVFFF